MSVYRWIHMLMGFYFVLMFLFYISEFTIHTSLPGSSTSKLISDPQILKSPKKVILVIIDSLRYDYIQRFPFVSATLTSQPQKSFVAKCKVSSPTMTTQRVESIMTGSEIFSSANIFKTFFASKTPVDNIISQLNSQHKTSMVFGDDTWVKLFSFTGSKTCTDTYNVHDYDTCDKSIYDFMIKEMTKGKGYDLIVSHFLSLDHIGHSTSSVHDPSMDLKIRQISAFIEKIMKAMDNDTILFVTGDHGMRNDGNHGGSSEDELNTFLFGFNKQINFLKRKKQRILRQPDITATLALYLNVSLPLNAVGIPIFQALSQKFINQPQLQEQLYIRLVKHFKAIKQYYKYQNQPSTDFDKEEKIDTTLEIIEDQLQKYVYRLQFLKYSRPNELLNLALLALLSIISIVIVGIILQIHQFIQALKQISYSSILNWTNKFLISFTLFAVYFSWNLIRNLSNVYLIIFIVSIILICLQRRDSKIEDIDKLIVSIILQVFLICQIQPEKTNQYSTNCIRSRLINSLLTSKISKIIFIFLLVFKSAKSIRRTHLPKNIKLLIYIILFVAELNYILTFCFNHAVYQLRVITVLLTITSIIYSSATNQQDFHLGTSQCGALMFLFLGQNGPIILLFCQSTAQTFKKLKVSSLFFGFLAQMIWWLIGNRFEYSGVDVVKSYIFSSQYHFLLNGTCLLCLMIAPHLTLFLHMSLHGKHTPAPTSQRYLQIGSVQEDEDLQMNQSINNINIEQKLQRYCFGFIVVPLLGLLSCVWNVDYNNSKILFTIVYIPMLMFCFVKIVLIYMLITIVTLIKKNKVFIMQR